MACITPLAQAKEPGYWAIISTGKASYYNDRFQGKKTANGERYDKNALTAANRSLPMGTVVRVTNLKNGRHLLVRINDRGPTKRDFIVDVSREAAKQLHMLRSGVVPVQMEVVTDKRGVPIHAKEAFYVQLAESSTLEGAKARLKTLASINDASQKISGKTKSKPKKMDILPIKKP